MQPSAKQTLIATFVVCLAMTTAWSQSAGGDVEHPTDIPQTDIDIILTCATGRPNDGLDKYRSGNSVLVVRGRAAYGLEVREIRWEHGHFVISLAAPEPVARLFVPEAYFTFIAKAPAITEIRCIEPAMLL